VWRVAELTLLIPPGGVLQGPLKRGAVRVMAARRACLRIDITQRGREDSPPRPLPARALRGRSARSAGGSCLPLVGCSTDSGVKAGERPRSEPSNCEGWASGALRRASCRGWPFGSSTSSCGASCGGSCASPSPFGPLGRRALLLRSWTETLRSPYGCCRPERKRAVFYGAAGDFSTPLLSGGGG